MILIHSRNFKYDSQQQSVKILINTAYLSLNNILFGNMVILHTIYIHNYRIGKQV